LDHGHKRCNHRCFLGFDVSDYRGILANFLGHGIDVTHLAGGGWIRNRIDLEIAGYEVSIIQQPEIARNRTTQFRGKFVHTSDVLLGKVPPSRVRYARGVVHDMAQLLSFAAMSPVRFFAYEYPAGSGMGSRWSTYGVANSACPVIDIRDGNAVRSFLLQSWGKYRSMKYRRRLPVVFDLLWLPEQPTHPLQTKLLHVFVAMESLKFTYAMAKRIPFARGHFRHTDGRAYSFRDLVTMMLREVGMRRGLKRLVALRNEVIHSALPRRSAESQRRTYRRCHDVIREYLLRTLGYSGNWMSFANLARRVV